MVKAMYPGTFDPITKGHLDIIKRAAKMYDELYVTIMNNPRKSCTFTVEERLALIEKCLEAYPNVKAVIGNGLTVDFAKKLGCQVLVRGIRAVADYEYELAQATTNMMLAPELESVFLMAKPEYSFLSSSIAKEIAMFGGDIGNLIPEAIQKEVVLRLQKSIK